MNNDLRKLAGLPVITEKKWSGEVDTKKHPPEDLFAKGSKGEIVEWLKKTHKDFVGAMSALNFYINRAGRNLSADRRVLLNSAKNDLRRAYGMNEALEPFDFNLLRKMAGLAAQPNTQPVIENSDDEASDEKAAEEMPALPEIVTTIAQQAEGKTGEELADIISKVYDAGVQDGIAQAEEQPVEDAVEEGLTEAARKDLAAKKAEKAVASSASQMVPSIGVNKEDDAGWMAVELAKAGMTVDMEEAMGVFYFNFKTHADAAKAQKLAKKLQIELQ